MVSRDEAAPPPPYLTAAALAFHERDMRTGPDIWTPVEKNNRGKRGRWREGRKG